LIKHYRSTVLVAAAALTLTACGGSSGKKAAEQRSGAVQSAISQAEKSPNVSNGGASSDASTGANPASVDVCGLLTPADVNAVAQADKLDSEQTASTVYTLSATKVDGIDGDSVCSFEIDEPAAYRHEGTIEFTVSGASTISDYNNGTKVSGLGDEAYAVGKDLAVRVGGKVLLAEPEDSFLGPAAMVTDLVRKMIARLN
jgi:hypothetical protein